MMAIVVRKKKKELKREYQLTDLTRDDSELLKQACFQQDSSTFVCLGKHYMKLRALKLVDDEMQVTYKGRSLVKYLLSKLEQ